MQNFLEWLDDHDLLDPLEHALEIVGIILYAIWCVALAIAAVAVAIAAIAASPWWLLAYIPLLALLVLTLMVYYYIDARR